MNDIRKIELDKLGYDFIEPKYLPEGCDEFYLRNLQNRNGINYRQLTAYEIEALVRNRNSSDNWNNLLVSDAFNPELVKNCKFYGLVRIGKLEPFFLEYSQMRAPVGLYNSTIISCDFGDNVVIDNVNYLSHYIIGSEVIIVNVNEMLTTPFAKFGNGIVKEGEAEDIRIWMELRNENAGRRVIPFNGMLPGDAWLWSKYRDNEVLLEKFKIFTEKKFETKRGFYGKTGDRTVIKNCAIIKDVWIGSDAYLKGANKLKNLTIESRADAPSQIGEGCELVNGIIGFGCRIFYGVKAVRFIMASNSQLKYGARLINSYLGNNATISCCEVLNSLIFPAHEQHHNNSFLCAALIMGQSNMAAGATIGSNHNSRSADGEMIAGRGFWPGLCVSLKHNSRFASFTIIAKGDYPAELDIAMPFSLVSQDLSKDVLQVMPAYWFMYNMYGLARNAWKYIDRDKRPDKVQHIEYDYLAPDTVNEMFTAMMLLEKAVGNALVKHQGKQAASDKEAITTGKKLLGKQDESINSLEVLLPGFENSNRKIIVLKTAKAYGIFKELVSFYGALAIMKLMEAHDSLSQLQSALPARNKRSDWQNIGGQLIPARDVDNLLKKINGSKINSWDEVHDWYTKEGDVYDNKKQLHALASLKDILGIDVKTADAETITQLLQDALSTKKWMLEGIKKSRAKDYNNPFRKMVYDTQAEMDKVMGSLADNSFIRQEEQALVSFEKKLKLLTGKLNPAKKAKQKLN
ncbi:DUF4954 family protein [soil metagenome]